MLEVIELSKAYKKAKVVNNISLFLERGETIGLLGPNGAGKSTTISLISSLIKPSSGDIRINGKSSVEDPIHMRQILGVVPQELALYDELTARENLDFFGRTQRMKGKQLAEKVDEILNMISLTDRQHDRVKIFSGGMKRRLNIGIALLHSPKLLIMDEPTVGIDPQSRFHILESVKRLNQHYGISVIYTSHYMEEVEQLCNRIYIMDKGNIIASGTKEELRSILSSEQIIHFKADWIKEGLIHKLQSHPSVSKLTHTDGSVQFSVPKNVNILADLFKFAEEQEMMISAVQIEAPTLEDVFLHLTGRTLRD
ncbi:antibiotic ABC transporter ATP-binding protein [Bacillus sp. VT 712]|uniref:Antibiotic ABC transporter ATP-binding protein n=1 Tax=Priestia veravalensis TaxID=1414648 RepID=A0A0V8JLW8_9BACI|nr:MULTISPECIES: ABC transporter ATP-binding protein [Bacillaceae]KSU88035.1 antibiotic ABC transporter ATP-binding protein [Priestia veravalensis]KZB91310.1 antibiotic ABC transporter ATP-binding protein [Bacillus sp. VT 712]SCC23742.1 ABC-2 type transport system ATP-binding protein [Priestia flexa]